MQIRASAVLILAEISNLNMKVIIKCTLIVLFKYMTPSYKWPIASLRNEEGSAASLIRHQHLLNLTVLLCVSGLPI